jgi:16S rRNA (uracil1498-N3)-methyltransferase
MRIYIPPEDIQQKEKIKLSSDKSHHLITVFRCKQGNAITVIDGKGKAYEAEVSRIVKKDVFINIIREVSTDVESPLNLIICQGILRGEKMDIVVQKTTELGIKEIIPVVTERTVIRDTRRLKRWRKIAEESVEQCGRTIIPVIHEPVYFEDFFKCQQSSVMDQKLNGLIFWEEGGLSLRETIRRIRSQDAEYRIQNSPIYILIGPEGGFASGEVKIAEENGLIRTTLGRRVLRAETAAIVSVALVQFLLEN